MSEETPQKLRLKPRVAGDAKSPAAPAAAAPSSPAPAASSAPAAPVARPKMRLGFESPALAAAPADPVVVPPVEPPSADSPPVRDPTEEAKTESRPKFALRPREAAAESPVASASGMPSPEPPAVPVPPAEQEVAPPIIPPLLGAPASAAPLPAAPNFPPPPVARPGTGSMPPPPKVAATGPAPGEAPKSASEQRRARRKRFALYGGLTALVVFAGLGTGLWLMLDQPEPPVIVRPRVVPKPAAAASSPGQNSGPSSAPTPSAAPAAPGPISRTKATIAAVQSGRMDPTSEVVEAATAAPGPSAGAPATPSGSVVPSSARLASEPAGAPLANPAFRAWVQNVRISGVRAGTSPRVFIERTAYAQGDLVNPQLGVVFDGYNPETRLLRFKDASGAIVERRH